MSGKRVAVCAVAQHKNNSNLWYRRFQGMLLNVLEDLQEQTGFDFNADTGIKSIVSCSDDFFDGRTISNAGVTDVLGAQYRGEEKMAQEGLNALGYAMSIILSGYDDLVLVMGHCKESQSESRELITNLGFDPFFSRAIGLDYLNAAALQARSYIKKSGLDEDQLAKIVVRARQCAARNPYANVHSVIKAGEVKASPMLCDPIRELHAYPVSDGAVGMLLASEELAYEFTDKPVWLTGFANCMDGYFFGDRDLTGNFALKSASERTYKKAGIQNPKKSVDLLEVTDAYAYQLPLWLEGLGFCEDGQGANFLNDNGLGKYKVNMSGGTLAGDPIMISGLFRAANAVLQLRGDAGEMQIPDVQRALAHSASGPAGQFHSVLILEV